MQTVLAVDDSQAMLNMVRQTLEFGGYQVITASDGMQALERLRETTPSLVVTDVNMPVMDGITLIREIRKRNAALPILTLTTESDAAMKDLGLAAGATGWIVKPFVPAQLLDLVKQVLD